MTNIAPILEQIDRYLEKTGMRPTTFGLKAINDPHLVGRLRAGGDVTTRTAERLRDFMKSAPRKS